MASRELRLIKSILAGIERDGHGELWVREQFRQHTESVLLELQMGRLAPEMMNTIKSLQAPTLHWRSVGVTLAFHLEKVTFEMALRLRWRYV